MSGGVPAGWVLVPVEPTEAMVDAAIKATKAGLSPRNVVYDAIAATPTPPIEGRDADVERATVTLDVFLAAYRHRPDHKLARPIADDDLLTWGDLRTILAALQALGERG